MERCIVPLSAYGKGGEGARIATVAEMSLNCLVQSLVWPKAIQSSADPQRARHILEQLKATSAAGFLKAASAEQARILAALFSGSQALSELLVARPDWLQASLVAEHLQHSRQKQGLERDLQKLLKPFTQRRDFPGPHQSCEFKRREMPHRRARSRPPGQRHRNYARNLKRCRRLPHNY
jgi:hypothetical protein